MEESSAASQKHFSNFVSRIERAHDGHSILLYHPARAIEKLAPLKNPITLVMTKSAGYSQTVVTSPASRFPLLEETNY